MSPEDVFYVVCLVAFVVSLVYIMFFKKVGPR